MKWVTREHVHLDRVASPWLIQRFIDPGADFIFVPWLEEHLAPADAIPFSLPGVALGSHDATGTTFSKLLRHYDLHDAALDRIETIISRGVAVVVSGFRPDPDDEEGHVAVGLLALSEGIPILHRSDGDVLAASYPIFDALYARYRVRDAMADRRIPIPSGSDGRGPTRRVEAMRAVYDDLPGVLLC